MEKCFRIYFTSDTHGYFSPLDYAANVPADTGLANCAANFVQDGNSLIIDGGDILQGSPFTYWLQQQGSAGARIPAELMNLAGYQFVTIGNHDFNYGSEVLAQYLDRLDARCLCANVHGLPGVERTAVVTLKNGLRIGLTGITTSFIPKWEKPEHLNGITVTDPVAAAEAALDPGPWSGSIGTCSGLWQLLPPRAAESGPGAAAGWGDQKRNRRGLLLSPEL